MRSYFDAMMRYFEFSGRSTRAQYWLFWLISGVLTVGAVYLDAYLSGVPVTAKTLGPIGLFAALVHIVPGITVTIRRLHDIGRSGWWYFIPLVPLLGAIVLLVWMCQPSEDSNEYGERQGDSRRRSRPVYSTIPRVVRMGSNAARPPSIIGDSVIQRFI